MFAKDGEKSKILEEVRIKEDALTRCKSKYPKRPALYKEWKEMLKSIVSV